MTEREINDAAEGIACYIWDGKRIRDLDEDRKVAELKGHVRGRIAQLLAEDSANIRPSRKDAIRAMLATYRDVLRQIRRILG